MRVSLVAGPGSGKSTNAAKIYHHYKAIFHSIELVQEFVKEWAYMNKKPEGFDQYLISATQLHMEYKPLKAGVKNIVTDSPVILGAFYAKEYGVPFHNELLNISKMFDKEYPNMYFFLNRGDRKYIPHGRYETHDQAIARDNALKNFLEENKVNFIEVNNGDQIIEYVSSYID